MPIVPLPVFEADADPARRTALTDEEIYARLSPPATIVVRYGSMRMVAELPYAGDAKPGCGTKLVVRTVRGTEVGEMLTTTCGNSGCSKTVSRQEMLEYIDHSGGKEYPFSEHGRVMRVATIEDLNAWSAIRSTQRDLLRQARELCAPFELPMKVVEVEPLFGGEMLTIFYLSEERIDFRDLVKDLAAHFGTRIEMRQVGARDEARLTADYERCGQHCCCKNFLKVLKPVSMKSAKMQKATLDPLKISGRCGRLMCCLRYEDETYEDLKKRLPTMKSRVGTSEGPGIVVDAKILVQLVLVQLEHDGREIAVAVEELLDPETCPRPGAVAATQEAADPLRGMDAADVRRKVDGRDRGGSGRNRASTPPPTESAPTAKPAAPAQPLERQDAFRARAEAAKPSGEGGVGDQPAASEGAATPRKRRRRRRRRRGPGAGEEAPSAPGA